jgi:NADPH:quinone reductase-like Zn-dependent oxidoreductase
MSQPQMRAARVHRFGGSEVIALERVPVPAPAPGEILVQVKAAGVGPWDALIRSGKSALEQPLPLTLGADCSGIVHALGAAVDGFHIGDPVFGATNNRFTGACADYAAAKAGMIAAKPEVLNFEHAASVPVIAVTAWQMVFEIAGLEPGMTALVHGGAGNVGRYLIQFAKRAGATVITTAAAADARYVRALGAAGVIDYRKSRFEERVKGVDAVLDTVGGETLKRSYGVLKRGGIVVSSAERPAADQAAKYGVRAVFFLVAVNAERLNSVAALIPTGGLMTEVGEVLSLEEIQRAHQMLAGAPHRRGKIIIRVAE